MSHKQRSRQTRGPYVNPFLRTTSAGEEMSGPGYRAIDQCKFYGPEARPLK